MPAKNNLDERILLAETCNFRRNPSQPKMNRRHFNRKAMALAALSTVPNALFSQTKKYKIGYQLYSIRDAMAIDPVETLKSLKSMGYQDFETYGYVPEKDEFYGFKSAEFKSILDDLGLSTTSGHYGFADYLEKSEDDMRKFVDKCIIGAKQVGHRYITWPFVPPAWRNAESYRKLPEIFNRVGDQITKSGLGFAYHNHGYEFSLKRNHMYYYQIQAQMKLC